MGKLELFYLQFALPDFSRLCRSLSDSSRFLQSLILPNNQLGDAGVVEIVACNFRFINALDLSSNLIGREGVRMVAGAGWNYLKSLNLE